MDDQSGLVQIVHGNVRGGVLIGDVEDNRLALRLYIANKTDEDRLSYDHAPDGELILAGTGPEKQCAAQVCFLRSTATVC